VSFVSWATLRGPPMLAAGPREGCVWGDGFGGGLLGQLVVAGIVGGFSIFLIFWVGGCKPELWLVGAGGFGWW